MCASIAVGYIFFSLLLGGRDIERSGEGDYGIWSVDAGAIRVTSELTDGAERKDTQ